MEGLAMSPHFWRGKRVLLTGHTGFKGSWLALWLDKMGAIVTGFALPPPTTPSLFEVANVQNSIRSIIGDIRDPGLVVDVVTECSPEVIIHMAAQPLVRYSYSHPVETYSTNVMGTVHLLEAVRHTPSVRAIVNVTSDKCYENHEWVWGYRENEAMGGHDPYSNSKGCAELITSAFRNSYFPPAEYDKHRVALASARAGNVIGGGDWALDRLIPDIINAISNGQSVKIRAPKSIRPWQHVLEPLSGYLLLAERLYNEGATFAEGWNFGPSLEEAATVEWITERLTTSWGFGASWITDNSLQPHEAHYLKLDCSKAQLRLGWQPRWTLETALERIVLWHKAYESGANMRAQTLSDIKHYCNSDPRH